MREYLIRLIYCEMLGVDCSWGYIHAVKMTQSHSTLEKRIGKCAHDRSIRVSPDISLLLGGTPLMCFQSQYMYYTCSGILVDN